MDIKRKRTLRDFLGQITLGNLPDDFTPDQVKHLHDIYSELDGDLREARLQELDEDETPSFLKPQAE